jgi:hypothetical protein
MVTSNVKNRLPFSRLPSGTALVLAAALGGCLSGGEVARAPQTQVVASAAAPSTISVDTVIGRWGIASFHNEKDRKRTEEQARAACNQPYVISKGPRDGVMMHVADDAKLYELKLKGGPGGRNFLGFEAPPGDLQDREILSASDSMLVMRFVDPDAHRRYGTFIYVRCR